MKNEKAEKTQQGFHGKTREIHEISRVTRFRQITIPRTAANILEICDGGKLYWIKSRKKSHSPDIFDLTFRVIHTKKRRE